MTININKCPLLGEGSLFGSVSTCQGNSSFFCTGRYIYISSFRLEVFKSFPSKNPDLISLPADVGVIIFTSTRGSARQIHTWRDVVCLSPSRMESVRLVSLKLSNLASAHSQHLVVDVAASQHRISKRGLLFPSRVNVGKRKTAKSPQT